MELRGISALTRRVAVGSAHGRFQPLHNGHMEYLLAAKSRCEFLWVGVTQYIASALHSSAADPHRAEPMNNPLTYFERAQLISRALTEARVSPSEFGIIPFPIEEPDLLEEFLPRSVPVFTTIYDRWNRHKLALLQALGYNVHVLWERDDSQKTYRGTVIRELIATGTDSTWQSQVPPATVELVDELQLRQRLRRLRSQG